MDVYYRDVCTGDCYESNLEFFFVIEAKTLANGDVTLDREVYDKNRAIWEVPARAPETHEPDNTWLTNVFKTIHVPFGCPRAPAAASTAPAPVPPIVTFDPKMKDLRPGQYWVAPVLKKSVYIESVKALSCGEIEIGRTWYTEYSKTWERVTTYNHLPDVTYYTADRLELETDLSKMPAGCPCNVVATPNVPKIVAQQATRVICDNKMIALNAMPKPRIKENEHSDKCVRCGAATKPLAFSMYCPKCE